MKKRDSFLFGFTLAEVLITLGIIGIVAMLILPPLVQNYQEKETITQLKRIYSILSQASLAAVADNGDASSWVTTAASWNDVSTAFVDTLAPYLKIAKRCDFSAGGGCFAQGVMYKRLNGNNYAVFDDFVDIRLKFRLEDGTSVAYYPYSTRCTTVEGTGVALGSTCGEFMIDLNGYKGPNIQGVDFFSIHLTKTGILVPEGVPDDKTVFASASGCQDKSTAAGWACAGWILLNGNMDYLHCSDLDWGGKTKCN